MSAHPQSGPAAPTTPEVGGGIEAALAHHQAGRHDEAETLYRRLLQADPADPTALYLFGLMNFERGRPGAAEVLLQRLAAARPDHAEAHVALANIRYWQGRFAAAAAGYRQALAVRPDHPVALINLGAALRDAGDGDGAVAAFETAITRLPDPLPAHLALGGALIAAGRPEAAAAAYGAAVALAPERADARAGLAEALLLAGRAEAALAAADDALSLDGQMADAWLARGNALSALRRFGEAITALRQGVELAPDRAGAHLNLGVAHAELEQAEDAIRHLRRALELEPGLQQAHASLGSVFMLVGDKSSAERHCWLALAVDPDMRVAHQNLAALYAERGEPDRARHHRDQAYGRQNVFVQPAVRPVARVLMPITSESGNIPYKFLLPAERYTRIDWVIEYADDGQAATLPPYDLVFNAIGDADAAGPTEAPMARFLSACERPLFNRPDRVARTHRHLLPDLLADIPGLVVPPVVKLEAGDPADGGLAAAVARAGLSTPVLVRPIGSHGGKGLIRALDAAELDAVDLGGAAQVYVAAYRDFASSDGCYRKYRMIFIDRRPYPYHLAVGDDWMVHYETAPMLTDAGRRAEEARFLADPQSVLGEAGMAAVAAVGARLDLDYCGVDFSLLPDGRVLVFEANATMLVHPEDPDSVLAYKAPYVTAILDAFQAMLARGG